MRRRESRKMPIADLADTISAAVQRNRGIPAMLDAYGEFADSPIGPLEVQHLDEVFARIEENLLQRFPEVASRRAASAARNDVLSFLSISGNNPDRVKQILQADLRKSVSQPMGLSIAERFARMNPDERRAIDATLRLIRNATADILFRAEAGKPLATAGREYERFFAAVKAEAPQMRELRYEKLIVEKGIFNKLLLKSSERENYSIWIPSLFAKDNVDMLVEKVALPSEHVILSRLREFFATTPAEDATHFLERLVDNQGVLSKPAEVPEVIADFIQDQGNYFVMSPIELDDVAAFLSEEEEKRQASIRAEEERKKLKEAEEAARREEELRMRRRPRPEAVPAKVVAGEQQQQVSDVAPQILVSRGGQGSIYIGKQLDLSGLVSVLARRTPESQIPSTVKVIGDFYLGADAVRSLGVAIVGSSGTGRSTTLRRIVDGLGSLASQYVIVIDQKGEHRGLAWKYQWEVLAFSRDSQAREFRIPFVPRGVQNEEAAEFTAELIQEWFLQSGLNCTDQQVARIASLVKASMMQHNAQEVEKRSQAAASSPAEISLERVVRAMSEDQELSRFGQKLSKSFLSRATASKIFYLSELDKESAKATPELFQGKGRLFDISGRGLRDPTTKEERQLLSVLLLHEMLSSKVRSTVIVLEDVLDRFKSQRLKKRAVEIIQKLHEAGNSFIVSSRTQAREFVGDRCIEILHRMSGEKAVTEELQGFHSDVAMKTLASIVGYLPRGYVITSQFEMPDGIKLASSAIRVEPLQFSGT